MSNTKGRLSDQFAEAATFELYAHVPQPLVLDGGGALPSDVPAPTIRGRIEPLTSLRFFAAAYVVLYHTWPNVFGRQFGLLAFGFASVSLFFTLSGYILAMVYLRPERPIDLERFYLARFARIYPLFFATLLFGTPLLLLARIHKYGVTAALAKTVVTFVGNCLMLQAWVLRLFGIDNPNWSLAAETFFYLVFPFAGLYLWRICGSLRKVAWAIAGIYLVGIGIVQACLVSAAFSSDAICFNPLFHVTEFFSGILIARMHTIMSAAAKSAIQRNAMWICVGSVFAFVAITRLVPPMELLNDGLLLPIFLSVLLALSAGNQTIDRLLSHPWLVLLGESSFAIYLIHFPLFDYFAALNWAQGPISYLAYLLVVLVLSVVSYKYLETPARIAINRHFARTSQNTLDQATATAG